MEMNDDQSAAAANGAVVVPNGVTPMPSVCPDVYVLTRFDKFLYAFGGPPMQMTTNVFGFFINSYLLEVVGLNPYFTSAIHLTARFWDAITDPAVGYAVTKTKTPWGRFRPWILISSPLAGISFLLLFFSPKFNSMAARFIYHLSFVILLHLFITTYFVPFCSMIMVITSCDKSRDSCSAYRMFFELTSTIIGVAIFGSILQVYHIDIKSIKKTSNITEIPFDSPLLDSTRKGYILASAAIGLIFFICGVVVFFGAKERETHVYTEINYFSTLKKVITFGPYITLTMAFLFISLGIQIVQVNLTLYIRHALDLREHENYAAMVLLTCGVICVPLVYIISRRYGKKFTFYCGLINFTPIMFIVIFLPKNPPVWCFYSLLIWAGPSVSVACLMPWSMLPDVIELFYLEKSIRGDVTCYSFYVFFNKLCVGLATAATSALLGLCNYKEGQIDQPESVGNGLRLIVGIKCLVCLFLSGVFLYFYRVDDRCLDNQRRRSLELCEVSVVNEDRFLFGNPSSSNNNNNQSHGSSSLKYTEL